MKCSRNKNSATINGWSQNILLSLFLRSIVIPFVITFLDYGRIYSNGWVHFDTNSIILCNCVCVCVENLFIFLKTLWHTTIIIIVYRLNGDLRFYEKFLLLTFTLVALDERDREREKKNENLIISFKLSIHRHIQR